MNRHNVFISYHHANDQYYRDAFEAVFSHAHDIFISKSVQIGDIEVNTNTERIRQKIRDEYLRESTVTIVLIGTHTWQRKHVDWEISSSLRSTQYSSRSGLLGIFLPTYPLTWDNKYNSYTIPPRLNDNLSNGFAKLYKWSNSANDVSAWIHVAFQRRNQIIPDNSRDLFGYNRSSNQWQ